jgi:hypothetical protein
MTKIQLDLTDEVHIHLLEIQLERKKKKKEPTALNKIAAEMIQKGIETEKAAN